jgi:hypothetical protein
MSYIVYHASLMVLSLVGLTTQGLIFALYADVQNGADIAGGELFDKPRVVHVIPLILICTLALTHLAFILVDLILKGSSNNQNRYILSLWKTLALPKGSLKKPLESIKYSIYRTVYITLPVSIFIASLYTILYWSGEIDYYNGDFRW